MIPAAGLVVEAWKDFDRVIDGVPADDAVVQPDGQSSIAWTLGHVTEHVDRWLNHTLQGLDRHPFLGNDRFRIGSSGAAKDWDDVRRAAAEVREHSGKYLGSLTQDELDTRHEFAGSISGQLGPLTVRYALFRMAAHHYFHIGVIACQRDLRGQRVGDYPGLMSDCLSSGR